MGDRITKAETSAETDERNLFSCKTESRAARRVFAQKAAWSRRRRDCSSPPPRRGPPGIGGCSPALPKPCAEAGRASLSRRRVASERSEDGAIRPFARKQALFSF